MPLLSRYSMAIYPAGGATPLETVDLGKPSPDPDGFIRVNFAVLLTIPLTPGQSYEATVSAIGPGGSSASGRSNTFGVSGPCSYSLSPSSQSIGPAAAQGSFAMSTGAGCAWTAVSQAPWITVTAGAAGTGPGTVSYSATANSATSARSGTILAAGWNFTLLQSGQAPACTFTISPTQRTVPWTATSISVTVGAQPGCAWTATSPASWALVTAGASGTGPGTVTITVNKYTGLSNRSATLTIAGQKFLLTQTGKRHR